MKLSICCITYNHEKFIAQTFQGFLMQKTTFDFEVVIGEDCSTDNTLQIIKDYQIKYPLKIKLFANTTNIGMLQNFTQTLKACSGEYIALCEGDDYWTDSFKLQKQVDFLEANPSYSLCHHGFKIYDDTSKTFIPSSKTDIPETYGIEYLSEKNNVGTLTALFRNKLSIPHWFSDLSYGDYPLHLLNAAKGKIKYFPEEMAVYRSHNASTIGRLNNIESPLFLVTSLEVLYSSNFSNNELVKKNLGAQLINLYLTLFYYYHDTAGLTKKQHYFNEIRELKNSFDSILIDQQILLRVYLIQIQNFINSGKQNYVASLVLDFKSEITMYLVNEIASGYEIKNAILKSNSYIFGNKIMRSLKIFSYKRSRKNHVE